MTGGRKERRMGRGEEKERTWLGNGRKVDNQIAWEGHERREMVDEQQPRTVLLFSGTRGWLRFVVVVATDSRPASQPASDRAQFTHRALSRTRERRLRRLKLFPLGPSGRDLSSAISTSFSWFLARGKMPRAASSSFRVQGLFSPPRSRSALMPRPRIILLTVGQLSC